MVVPQESGDREQNGRTSPPLVRSQQTGASKTEYPELPMEPPLPPADLCRKQEPYLDLQYELNILHMVNLEASTSVRRSAGWITSKASPESRVHLP
jgi:hypothetical protein